MIIPLHGYVAVIEDPEKHQPSPAGVTVSGKVIGKSKESALPEDTVVVFKLADALAVLLNCQTKCLLVQEKNLLAILPTEPLEEALL